MKEAASDRPFNAFFLLDRELLKLCHDAGEFFKLLHHNFHVLLLLLLFPTLFVSCT